MKKLNLSILISILILGLFTIYTHSFCHCITCSYLYKNTIKYNAIRSQMSSNNLEVMDAYMIYDDDYTTAVDEGEGYGKGIISISNTGTEMINITQIELFYMNETFEWKKLQNVVSLQDISPTNPYEIQPLSGNVELVVRCVLPALNDNNTVLYKIQLKDNTGGSWDTSEEANVSEDDMKLSADRPEIEFNKPLGYIRRIYIIAPTSIFDNSAIKNVTYEVFTDPGSILVRTKTVTSALWRWVWTTYNDSLDGLDNGSYTMCITVNDFAGLSDAVDLISFTIDNDYIPPTFNYIVQEDEWVVVGESFEIIANIKDSGSLASEIQDVFLYYRLQNESTYSMISMMEGLGNNWSAVIPAPAIKGDMTYYIEARDLDNNVNKFYGPILYVKDTQVTSTTETTYSSIKTSDSGGTSTSSATSAIDDQSTEISSKTSNWTIIPFMILILLAIGLRKSQIYK